MNAKEKAALADFVATVPWPARTVRAVSTPAGEQDFSLVGTWDSDHDTPMAWIDGNRVPFGSITWQNITETIHNEGLPDEYTTHSSSTIRLPSLVPFGRLVIILISPGSGSGYMPRNPGIAAFLGDVDFGGNRAKHLAPSQEPDDGVRRDEVIAIAESFVGANYALITGADFTGPITVQTATAGDNPARLDQVPLLNGTQDFTAEQKGVNASSATGLTTKQQVEAALSSATASFVRPNRKQVWSTPGTGATWTAPADGVLFMELDGPGGGAGGGSTDGPPTTTPGSGGNGGKVRVAIAVTAGQVATIDVGGGGYGAVTHDGSGLGGAGGGGGGRSTRVAIGSNTIHAGAGGGGGGNCSEPSGGNGGAAGSAGQSGQSSGGPGGAVGTAGGDGTAGGTGGTGATAYNGEAGSGGPGGGSSTPTTLLPSLPTVVEWPFGGYESGVTTGGGADGGAGVPLGVGNNGASGRAIFWWYQP